MSAEHELPCIYHVGRWRYLWIWFLFGTLGLVLLGMGLFLPGKPDERAGCVIGGALFLAVTLFIHVLIRWTRLELSEKGVRLRQIGYRLEAPWSDITDLWLDRGHESLVTSRPVGGKGQKLLAVSGRAMGQTLAGMRIYTPEQQAMLDEGRLIPIEAFAWHLRRGKLRADLEHFAPHLRAGLASLNAPDAPTTSSVEHVPKKQSTRPLSAWDWLIIGLIVLGIAGVFAFAASSKEHGRMLEVIGTAVFSGSLALSIGIGARNCYRIGSWLAGTGMALVSALLALWAFAELLRLSEIMGKDRLGMQFVVVLFFAFVTWRLGRGACKAFQRHRWVFGTLFLLAGAFTLLCTIFTMLDILWPAR